MRFRGSREGALRAPSNSPKVSSTAQGTIFRTITSDLLTPPEGTNDLLRASERFQIRPDSTYVAH